MVRLIKRCSHGYFEVIQAVYDMVFNPYVVVEADIKKLRLSRPSSHLRCGMFEDEHTSTTLGISWTLEDGGYVT